MDGMLRGGRDTLVPLPFDISIPIDCCIMLDFVFREQREENMAIEREAEVETHANRPNLLFSEVQSIVAVISGSRCGCAIIANVDVHQHSVAAARAFQVANELSYRNDVPIQ